MAAASPSLRASAATGLGLGAGALALVALGALSGALLAFGEIQALYLCLSIVATIAVLYDYRVGAVLLVLFLPLSATSVFPHQLLGFTGLNPINVLLAGTLVSYVLRSRTESLRSLVPPAVLWLYVLPIVAGGLLGMRHVDDILPGFYETETINFTERLGYLRDMVVKPLLLVLVALLVGAAVVKSKKPERFVAAIALSACALAFVEFAVLIASNVRLGSLASPRARAFYTEIAMHANGLGRLFVTAYALLLFVWWETKRPLAKMTLFATLGILSFAILFTFSRNAWLGFFIVSGLFLLWKFNAKTLSLAIGGLAIAAALAPEYVYRRLTFGFDTGSANVVSAGRIDGIWLPLLPELWKSPVWGNGVGSTMWAYPMRSGAMEIVSHPHNAFLEALLDMGVVGLVLLVAYYWHVWRGWRTLGSNAFLTPELRGFFQGACAAMIAFVVAGMTGGSLRPTADNALLWVAIGMMYGVAAKRPAQ